MRLVCEGDCVEGLSGGGAQRFDEKHFVVVARDDGAIDFFDISGFGYRRAVDGQYDGAGRIGFLGRHESQKRPPRIGFWPPLMGIL